jgi:hypothetical protein
MHDYTDTMNYSPSGSQSYHFEFPQPPRDKHTMTPKPPKHTIITITSERPETPEEHQVAADTAAIPPRRRAKNEGQNQYVYHALLLSGCLITQVLLPGYVVVKAAQILDSVTHVFARAVEVLVTGDGVAIDVPAWK